MHRQLTIGVDFGTLSARALLLNVETGEELATSVCDYPHGVMSQELPDHTPLPPNFALQHPADYLHALVATVHSVLSQAQCLPEEVCGLGIDFTSSTVLPVFKNGEPLCSRKDLSHHPHAWCKLWKHHGAAQQAQRMEQAAHDLPWIIDYGGRVSAEYLLPKALEILEDDPEVYHTADLLVEAGDWIVWQLCGSLVRSQCSAGFKSFWQEEQGYPSNEYFYSLNPNFGLVTEHKLQGTPKSVGRLAGKLTKEWATVLGLSPETPIATAVIDAHASLAGCGISKKGILLMILGTSSCHILLNDQKKSIKGINGAVKNGILPGYYAYEAGQSCVGDSFSWYIDHCLPSSYLEQSLIEQKDIHQFLQERAQHLKPGQSGLIALDWLNGVRSPLFDFGLSSVIAGLSIDTKPEEIYLALLESTAYGARRIVDCFIDGGIPIDCIYTTGGIASKSPLLMQIYADVLGIPLRVAGGNYSGARGSAIYAVLASQDWKSPREVSALVERLGNKGTMVYSPNYANHKVYDELYSMYLELSQIFGEEHRNIMKRLKNCKNR